MPIGFNFAPAGLAALLGQQGGENEAKRLAIAQAIQKAQADRDFSLQADSHNLAHQSADRSYELSQAQLARQAQQDQFAAEQAQYDNFLRAQSVQGQLSNLYNDQIDKDMDRTLREKQILAQTELQQRELTQRGDIAKSQLDYKQQQDKDALDFRKQSQADKVSHWGDTLDLRMQVNDQNVAQRDRESQARTQAAMAGLQARADKDQVAMQLRQYSAAMDAAKFQYQSANDALRTYEAGLKSGSILDDQATIDSRRQQLMAAIDAAKAGVNQSHDQYDQWLSTAVSSGRGTSSLPSTQSAPGAGPIAEDGQGNRIMWNGSSWVPYR
jgi:hypothetical protein